MHVAICDPTGKTEGSSERGLNSKAQFHHTMGSFRTLPPHSGTCVDQAGTCVDQDSWRSLPQAGSRVSVQIPGTGVDSVSRQLGGLIGPDFSLIGADFSMAGQVARSAWIAG
jgi:hypothetical protein